MVADLRLDELIRRWYESLPEGVAPTPTCPPLSSIWLHVTEDQPLVGRVDHVDECPHCRLLMAVMQRELDRPALVAVETKSKIVRWGVAVLAAAACISFVILNIPSESVEDRALVAFGALYDSDDSLQRGPGDVDAVQPAEEQVWLQRLMNDENARDAFSRLRRSEPDIQFDLAEGQIVIKEGRLLLAPHIDERADKRYKLSKLISDNDRLSDQIVDALIHHIPGASKNDRADLRKALDRWRAIEVFGVHE